MASFPMSAVPAAIERRLPAAFLLLLVGVAIVVVSTLAREVTVALSATQVLVIKLLLVTPVIEELFFRGVVHAELRRRAGVLGGPIGVIVLTALAFGAAHLLVAPVTHALAVMLPALAIGWVYERSRSIAACVLLHAACNAVWLSWELT